MPPLILSATVNTTGTTFVPRTLSVSGGLVVGTPSSSYSTGEFSSGIGSEYITYSPSVASDLKINSNTASSSLSLACSTSYNPSVYFFASTTSIASIYVDNSLTSRPLVFQTPTKSPNAGGTLCLTKDGNVGIGTTSPNYPLTVLRNNDGQIFNFSTSSGGWYGSSLASSGTFLHAYTGTTSPVTYASIGTYDNIPLLIYQNNTERMRITSSGNVGIGTSSPAYKLHVAGETSQFPQSIFIAATGHATSRRACLTLDDWLLLQDMNGDGTRNFSLYQGSAAATRLCVDTSGKVGIGTISPSNPLHVSGGQEWPAKFQFASDTIGLRSSLLIQRSRGTVASPTAVIANTNLGGLSIGGYDGTSYSSGYNGGSELMAFASENWTSTARGSYLTLSTTSDGSAAITERMRITSSGNVGIGTASPGFPLHISSSTSQNLATFNYSTAGGYSEIQVSSNDRSISLGQRSSTYPAGDLAYLYTPNATPFAIYNSATERLRINADGNIGIGGIAGTFYKLEVSGRGLFSHSTSSCELLVTSSANNAYFIVNAFTGYASYVIFRKNGADKWYLFNEPTMDRMYLTDQNSNDGVYISQNTTSWTSNSDLRLKNVQGTITNALDKVQQLTGVKFTWKRESDNPDAKVRVGLIAQDVQAVLPEAVDDDSPDIITDEDTGRVSGGLGVRYTEVVPLLVNAIKELTARVVALESQISSGAA